MTSSHRASWPSGSLNLRSQRRELWSVLTRNLCPYKKGLKCLMKVTTASSSFLVTQYFRSDLLRTLLAYAITFSCPSCIWDKAAPIAFWLASVSKINGLLKSGWVRIGADVNLAFKRSNAVWHSPVHKKGVATSVSLCSGRAILEKLAMNFL